MNTYKLNWFERIWIFFHLGKGKGFLWFLVICLIPLIPIAIFLPGDASNPAQPMQFLWKKSARSKGVVLTKGIIGSRGTRPNMKPIWRYGFSFEDQHGTLFEGESYSTELIFEKGDTVEVKFLISNPGFSKIKGSNRYTFSVGWIFFFCCAAPIFAIIFYAANGVWKSRLEQILKDFELSEGQKSKKNSKSSFTPSVISYSYEVQGKTLLRKFKRLNDEKSLGTDWILYQRTDPKQAILLGSIPDPIVKKILLKANKC